MEEGGKEKRVKNKEVADNPREPRQERKRSSEGPEPRDRVSPKAGGDLLTGTEGVPGGVDEAPGSPLRLNGRGIGAVGME